MNDYDVLNDYFLWLCDFVSWPGIYFYDYTDLLSYLQSIEFRWTIVNDQNRALDGHNLRLQYAEGVPEKFDILENHLPTICSVFEMFVAIAIRCENYIMHDPYSGVDTTGHWFWMSLRNMGLLVFSNENFDVDYVSNIVWKWMDRCYDYNGNGSPYPLKDSEEDLRGVEIWGQLSRYLNENFDI